MRVTEEEAEDLRYIKNVITECYVRNPHGDVGLVCRKTAEVLEKRLREKGNKIDLDYVGMTSSYIPPKERYAFTPEIIAELAVTKLTRLCYYIHHGRRRGTPQEILDGIRGHLKVLASELSDGRLILNAMADVVSRHYGTPLVAVE